MNKDNVFRSSEFHMDTGDVLHMLIQDESGATVAIGLYGSSEPDIVEDFNIGSVTVS